MAHKGSGSCPARGDPLSPSKGLVRSWASVKILYQLEERKGEVILKDYRGPGEHSWGKGSERMSQGEKAQKLLGKLLKQ